MNIGAAEEILPQPLMRTRYRPMAQFMTDPAIFPTDATAINITGLLLTDASSRRAQPPIPDHYGCLMDMT